MKTVASIASFRDYAGGVKQAIIRRIYDDNIQHNLSANLFNRIGQSTVFIVLYVTAHRRNATRHLRLSEQ